MTFKKTLKSTAFALLLASSTLSGAVVDALSATVNGEPITLYEIHRLSQAQQITLDNAFEELVQERLIESQIKALGITADSFEIRSRIDDIARQNNISYIELITFIRSKNMKISDYEEEIAKGIKQEKLYQRIFMGAGSGIDEVEMLSFYRTNRDSFLSATHFEVIVYESPLRNDVNDAMLSPMRIFDSVKVYDITYENEKLDREMQYYLNQTKEGEFTPIIERDGKHFAYKVNKKLGLDALPFESVKGSIANHLEEKYRREAINNYFEKLRTRADIVVIRRP